MQNIEIERKFLVDDDYKSSSYSSFRIKQGYILTKSDGVTVRIRIKEDQGYITIKGKTNESGTTRFEWEKELPLSEAEQLICLCGEAIIDKTRYLVKSETHVFEVDEFHGENEGLVVAEIELSSENEYFIKPSWLGEEVTGDLRYYNSQLQKYPYKLWS